MRLRASCLRSLVDDDGLKKIDNPLLPGGEDVELAPNLAKTVVHMRT